MKHILVPTDFSIYAKYATDMAINLAKKFGATLHLFTSLDVPEWSGMSSDEKEKANYQESLQLIHNAEQLFKEWKEKAAQRGVELKTFWASGKLTSTILQYQENNDIDCIVMGSHGTKININSVLGSNTQRVVRKVRCPVFIIKTPIQVAQFKNIVFASGFNEFEKEGYENFLRFIQSFEPDVIHLLQIDTSSWFTPPYAVAKEALKDFKKTTEKITNCKIHFYQDYSVDAGIRHFAEDINADLIVISNHHRRPLKRALIGSNVEDLIRSTDLPLLSFDYSLKTSKTPTS